MSSLTCMRSQKVEHKTNQFLKHLKLDSKEEEGKKNRMCPVGSGPEEVYFKGNRITV